MSNAVQLLEQAEGLLNRGEIAVALGLIGMAKKEASEATDEAKDTLPDRIEALRGDLFAVQSIVAVTRDSIDRDEDFARHSVLDRVYDDLNAIATEMESVAGNVRRAVSVISDALLVSP